MVWLSGDKRLKRSAGGRREAAVRKWAACILILTFGAELRVSDHTPSFAFLRERWIAVRKRLPGAANSHGSMMWASGDGRDGEVSARWAWWWICCMWDALHRLWVMAPQVHLKPEAAGSWIWNILCAKNSIALCLKIFVLRSWAQWNTY